ncbi:MAG: hypothetical protein PHO92_00875 [Candidatus Peribacteraceae bacterium]|nr:hypothetical protein [Candidatus Peribacteraceae bacterium]
MQRTYLLTAAFLLLAAPLGAQAKEETVWSFLEGNVPGQWEVKGLDPVPSPTPEGLLVQTNQLGRMQRTLRLPHPIEWIAIDYVSPAPTEALLISRSETGEFTELPFLFEQAIEPDTVFLDVSTYSNWNPVTTEIGLVFPENAQLLIRTISFSSSALQEKAIMALRSFWQFDQYTPRTINFLWGPRIALNTAERALMYAHTPPHTPSVNWVFYILLLGTAITLAFRVWTKKTERHKAILLMASLTGALWLLYDMRMGAEFIGYAVRDYQTYLSKPLYERTFRVRGNFNAFAELVRPSLQEEKEYVFLPHMEQYAAFLRYETYPALPVKPEQAGEDVRYWAIYQRPDILMDAEGQLMHGDTVLTPPGTVVAMLDNDSFLFRINE